MEQEGEAKKGSALFIRHTTLSAKFARRAQLDKCCCCSFFLLLFLFILLLLRLVIIVVQLPGARCFTLAAFARSIYTNANKHTHALALTHTHAYKCIYSTVHSTHTTLCYLHCAHVVVAAAAFTVVVVLVQFPCHCTFVHKLRMRRQRRRRALIKSLLAYNSLTHPHTHIHTHIHIQLQVH